MGIRDLLDSFKQKRESYKAYAQEMKIREEYEAKKKSANERELERYLEEEHQKAIKFELERYRKKSKYEAEFGHQILHTKNMFEKEKPIVMKQKSLFGDKSNLNTPGGLFFK